MPKKLHKEIPLDYQICLHNDCPRATSCLHQLACQSLMKQENILQLINPSRCTKDEKCTYYRNAAPISYARGFIGMQQQMLPAQYKAFMSALKSIFGRNSYYERRRGDSPLSPDEQKIVLNTLRQVGVTKKLKFDRYEENINWYD